MIPTIKILKEDITTLSVDAIVNSAHWSLMKGSGICGIIHSKAGPELEKECIELKKEKGLKKLPIGEVIATKAYNLPAKYVIHAVGAKNNGIDDINLIKNCYLNSMIKADELKCESISFPAISTGVYGLDMTKSAHIIKSVLRHLPKFVYLKNIYFVVRTIEDIEIYKKVLSSE